MIWGSTADSRAQIVDLLCKAQAENQIERRQIERHPFFYPVSIAPAEADQIYSAFSRDISATGMGFLHNMPLGLGHVNVTIHSDGAPEAALSGEIVWCKPCGEGWYTSGMRFA